MEPDSLSTVAQVLSATGPYGFVAVLSWALWRVLDRKDRQLRTVYDRLVQLSEVQAGALAKVEAALVALRQAIERFRKD
jgi:hypothetical protein